VGRVKVKVKVQVKFTLEQATKAQRESRGIYSFFNLGARWGGWSTPRPGRFTPGKDPVPIVQAAGWAPGPVWTGAENLAPHRESIPGPSSLWRVAISTELSRSTFMKGQRMRRFQRAAMLRNSNIFRSCLTHAVSFTPSAHCTSLKNCHARGTLSSYFSRSLPVRCPCICSLTALNITRTDQPAGQKPPRQTQGKNGGSKKELKQKR
jgi:hypothetical protein